VPGSSQKPATSAKVFADIVDAAPGAAETLLSFESVAQLQSMTTAQKLKIGAEQAQLWTTFIEEINLKYRGSDMSMSQSRNPDSVASARVPGPSLDVADSNYPMFVRTGALNNDI
jgi:hypothetical protein